MQFIADLHIHSHYSRATSKLLTPEYLDYQAGIKGIKVVGTGDFTHPGWMAELKEKLEPEGNGLFRLKKEFRLDPLINENETRFILTAEISNIYKRGGKVRKVHNVVFAPGFDEAGKINQKLINLGGNLKSDGRPILGLDSRDLLEITLECNDENFFVPAHIWTPWFSMLGSKSGFDSPEECFGSLWPYIYAIETGLSTDAPMNWLCPFLDRCALISNSDAHSPGRLGRNANVFNTELSYSGITEALKQKNPGEFSGTIDLFPQEGKYHYDGHRKCNVCWNPVETIKNNSVCPVCGKPVTVGVMNRVVQLSGREDISERPGRLPFRPIIPLKELMSEIEGLGGASKKVNAEYEKIIRRLGPELDILLNIPVGDIELKASRVLAEAIRRMRNREVIVKEGYDGEYGQIKVFNAGEIKNFTAGKDLFVFENKTDPPPSRGLINFDLKGLQVLLHNKQGIAGVAEKEASYKNSGLGDLNPEQKAAVEYSDGASLILAGPGTGKTKTLTSKIYHLIDKGIVSPGQILAITFTNKAAGEMKHRLRSILGENGPVSQIFTFHGLGKFILEEHAGVLNRDRDFLIIDESDKLEILNSLPGINSVKVKKISSLISDIKQQVLKIPDEESGVLLRAYEKKLEEFNAFDFDDLIAKTVELFLANRHILDKYRNSYPFIFIDEFQDTNLLQFELIKLLADGGHPNLCVVGDPNQAIYSFRGGGSKMITLFTEEFPGAKIFRLKTSYRCSNYILSASSGILTEGSGFLSGLTEGVKIAVSEQATGKSEAEYIAREIVNLAGGVSFFSIDSDVAYGQKEEAINSLSDFAVLCRTRHQFKALEKAFHDHNIPYQAVGEKPFYSEPPLSSLLEVYHAAVYLNRNQYARWLLKDKDLIFKQKLEDIHQKIIRLPSAEGLGLVKETFFENEGIEEQDFKRLANLAGQKIPVDFISSLKLGTASDTYNEALEAVTLMTLHASKGLEFECVFIAGCEDGLIPYHLYGRDAGKEEEARLLYVGMTRAKKFLYLSHARSRSLLNRTFKLPRSPFLDKIKKELVEKTKSDYRKKKEQKGQQLNLFNNS